MPADFERCVRNGGRVWTKTLSKGRYIKICYDKDGSHAGEVHESKKQPSPASRALARVANGAQKDPSSY